MCLYKIHCKFKIKDISHLAVVKIYFQNSNGEKVYLAIGGWGSSPSQGLASTESLVENGPAWTLTLESLPFIQWYFPSVTWQNVPYIFGMEFIYK